jgi:hypothetical protein
MATSGNGNDKSPLRVRIASLLALTSFAAMVVVSDCYVASAAEDQTFNAYVLKAISSLQPEYGGKGYDIHKAYTHDIPYDGGVVKATKPPWTMCVAAVAEVIIAAINIYTADSHDQKPYQHLPVVGWNRTRPTDIRSYIWVDPKLNSYGTADALVAFGVGKRASFADLIAGSFINFNRTNGFGHAVVFIAFLDENGKEFPPTTKPDLESIAGFKYYSAQNRNTHGLGYGYAFFTNKNGKSYCPKLPNGLLPDCKVEYSVGQRLLNTGYMLAPQSWDMTARDRNLAEMLEGLYVQSRSRGPSFGLPRNLTFDEFTRKLQSQDTMRLNPIYENSED